MPPRLDKARGLERRPMAYQVRLPNIQVQQPTFKKLAPQASQNYKKVSRPAAFPPAPPPPASTMTSLIANTSPKYLYVRDCVCCPVGTTSHTIGGMVLKVVFQPGCEKCANCTCKLVEVPQDQPNPWKLFWDLNVDCGYCHATGENVEHESMVKEEKSFDRKIWEAFVYTDGADGADGFIGPADVGGQNLDVGAAGAAYLNEVTGLGVATSLNGVTGDFDGISILTEDPENDPFATYFAETGPVVLTNSGSDDERWLDSEDSDTEIESVKVVDVVIAGGGIKSEKHVNQRGVRLTWKGLYGDWRGLFGY
ncbi:uncharacterized protein H6S33_004222 [Morchella sextelata]|uniref:uncharacterized protein n=1 Tax=Morchella sextelata TaxID=1174677 RepID=UPI001D047E7E|nr:uncharacterized protein H6S33_004222 [Morchella sextelata]KAH0605765.1 hypothetical protein H6S33_004222 [Morchella sextelata]